METPSPAVRYVVSSSGQMSLPAAARHRWHLKKGGTVDVIDLGFGVMIMPEGMAPSLFDDLFSREEQEKFLAELDDPDLMTT